MPCGLLACSAGIGHTPGAWSLQETWQMKEHTEHSVREEGQRSPAHSPLLTAPPIVPLLDHSLTLCVCVCTFTGVALPAQPDHQGGAVCALGGAGEGLDAQLMRSGLRIT